MNQLQNAIPSGTNPFTVKNALKAFETAGFLNLTNVQKEFVTTVFKSFFLNKRNPPNLPESLFESDRNQIVQFCVSATNEYAKLIGLQNNYKKAPVEKIIYKIPIHFSTGSKNSDGALIEIGLFNESLRTILSVTTVIKKINEIKNFTELSEIERIDMKNKIISSHKHNKKISDILNEYLKYNFGNKNYNISYLEFEKPIPKRSLPFGKERRALFLKRVRAFMNQKI